MCLRRAIVGPSAEIHSAGCVVVVFFLLCLSDVIFGMNNYEIVAQFQIFTAENMMFFFCIVCCGICVHCCFNFYNRETRCFDFGFELEGYQLSIMKHKHSNE